jgi:outer membrane lipoprotein SlyB
MRKFVLAFAATTMAMPVAFVAPTTAASAQTYHGRTWTDSRGRLRCRKSNGTVGLIVGGAGGALVGRAIDTHGSRTTGTLLGAAAGAVLGRHVQRNSGSRRCR